MLNDLSKKIDNQNENLKNISKCLETVSYIIKNTKNEETLKNLKSILKDLKPVLTDLECEITNLEEILSTSQILCNDNQFYNNNTLLISELKNKVVLPYDISDLQRILNENKRYHSIDEIIKKFYTLPITYYKSATKSRFKEAYKLMRKKEKASIVDSLSLSFEVCFNNSLNPAIITACNSLDELDTYLDCLSDNELDKFNVFNIKFEMLPHK